LTLWDGREYCRRCVIEVSPELCRLAEAGGRLAETIEPGEVSGLKYFQRLSLWYLLFVLVVFGTPSIVLFARGKVPIEGVWFVLGFFGGVGLCMIALQAIIGSRLRRKKLPRTVDVEAGDIVVRTPQKETRDALADCSWYTGRVEDKLEFFTGRCGGMGIITPGETIAAGYSADTTQLWNAFLTLARVRKSERKGCLWLLAASLMGLCVGAVIGAVIGTLAAALVGIHEWVAVLAILGGFDGGLASALYLTCNYDGRASARERLAPWHLAFLLAFFGVTFGVRGGWVGAAAVGSVNGLLGYLLAKACRNRIAALEKQQEESFIA
jgi:hypothetical protein